MTIITQGHDRWYRQPAANAPVNISDVCITDGGLLLLNSANVSKQIVTLTNVYNQKGSDRGGMYFGLLWPPSPLAIPKLVWDNTGCPHPVMQGPMAECAFRGKCDDAAIRGVMFQGWLQPNGQPYKQVVEIRHGKQWLFDRCAFKDSWPDIGRQQIRGQGYDQTQHVGVVTFDECRFTLWTPTHDLIHRAPGVGKIIYNRCIDPSGKTFSKTI